jgi:hypothetical protein
MQTADVPRSAWQVIDQQFTEEDAIFPEPPRADTRP